MSNPIEVLHVSGITNIDTKLVERAFSGAFDASLMTPGYHMEDWVGVAAVIDPSPKPRTDSEQMLAIGIVGNLDPFEAQLFAVHATMRAIDQKDNNRKYDNIPMERLGWVSRRDATVALNRSSAASVNGLHVGVAGGQPHHNRLFGIHLAENLKGYGYLGRSSGAAASGRQPGAILPELDDRKTALNLDWLNEFSIKDGAHLSDYPRSEYIRSVLGKIIEFPDMPRSA